MNSEEYWLKRALANSSKSINQSEYFLSRLDNEYKKSLREIKKQLRKFELKYGVDFSDDIYHVKRLNQLQELIQSELDRLHEMKMNGVASTLSEAYSSTYYTNIFDMQQQVGYGGSFEYLDASTIEKVINTAWSGASYSSRIWGHHQKISKEISSIISQGAILGFNVPDMSRKISGRMNVNMSDARRLVRTETNYVANQATLDSYGQTGVSVYRFLATFDRRTSRKCASQDGSEYPVSEAQVGYNYPPLHPNCRSTTIPVVNGAIPEVRVVKDIDGSYYDVPGSLKYDEWYQKHVVEKHGEKAVKLWEKKEKNRQSDKAQMKLYRAAIGSKYIPRTIADFQELKYNNTEKWKEITKLVRESKKISGALNDSNDPWHQRRDEHADMYYESVRKRNKQAEINRIAKNTGFRKSTISKVYDHVFINKYELRDGLMRFDPSYDMAQSWQRLREGKDIQPHDITLINHERMEYRLMNKSGMNYSEAHGITVVRYDYASELDNFNNKK